MKIEFQSADPVKTLFEDIPVGGVFEWRYNSLRSFYIKIDPIGSTDCINLEDGSYGSAEGNNYIYHPQAKLVVV